MDKQEFDDYIVAARNVGMYKACHQRLQYKDENTAQEAADFSNEIELLRTKIKPYPCPFCNEWHIGLIYRELKNK